MTSRLQRLLPDRIRSSYVAKFALVICVVLVVTVAAALFFYVDITGEITTNVQSEVELATSDEASELSSLLESHEETARSIAGTTVLERGSDEDVETRLAEEQRGAGDAVIAIHHVDLASDEIIHSSDANAVETDVSEYGMTIHLPVKDTVVEREYSGNLNVDSTYTDTFEYDGNAVIAFLSPVERAGDGETAVMVVASATELAAEFEEPVEGGHIRVVDVKSTAVLLAEDDDAIGETYREGEESALIDSVTHEAGESVNESEDDDGSGVLEYDDTDELVGYATVPETDWVLATHAPESNAYALADEVATSLLTLIAIAVGGLLVVGATIGRSTAHALDDLADNAVAISEGATDVEVADDDRIDEVGQVRRAFDGIQSYLETAADQADAIARQEFDDPALERDVPGGLGDSLETMRTDLERSIDDLEASKAEAEASREEAAEARREAEELAQRLERKAGEFADVMADAADGDFTRRLDENVDNDALAEIAAAFNGMLEDLEGTVVDIQDLAEEVDRVSRDVTARVEEIEQASTEVSTSADEIATATAEQSQRFQEVYGEMNDLSATVEEIASTTDDVATVSERAAEQAEAAGEASSEIRSEMDRLEDRTEAITDRIEQLDDEMGEIREIVDLIDDIAGQTNLLALNASIEAAAAGSEGDGFAVVADEVKSLAEETAEATQEVDDRISEVERSVEETVDEIERMRRQVDRGVDVVDDGIEAIDAITDRVDEANEGVKSIDEATDEQARASERVVTMVDEATENSEETKDETENVAAAVEEQTATIAEVASGAQTQTELAEELRDSLEAFDVDEGADGGGDGEGEGEKETENATDDAPLEWDEDDVDGGGAANDAEAAGTGTDAESSGDESEPDEDGPDEVSDVPATTDE
ncbi:methyl-accepting chemotaxis sensory transducer [Halobiforma lacisalsi AJ5]|uniref:Methyl-accepting chemotaxis sensory transducer n=1 Tax=Natronobacterium lacisalsi AJ5 TaxID=358396 RepID=M0LF39_NATLA|nr:methyl-accepting chemotaxis protein [Halobiforma lacisalsi]EMA32171.1 methyl-accepting chemotaxis sensory transducer [Halobiforma lacisalsi AJ5]